eukprot:jgi/Chlat1/2194/Chrsp17S02757
MALTLAGRGILLDIVDDEWMADTLPDDDIQLPAGTAPSTEEHEESTGEARVKEEDKWTETGLQTVT